MCLQVISLKFAILVTEEEPEPMFTHQEPRSIHSQYDKHTSHDNLVQKTLYAQQWSRKFMLADTYISLHVTFLLFDILVRNRRCNTLICTLLWFFNKISWLNCANSPGHILVLLLLFICVCRLNCTKDKSIYTLVFFKFKQCFTCEKRHKNRALGKQLWSSSMSSIHQMTE